MLDAVCMWLIVWTLCATPDFSGSTARVWGHSMSFIPCPSVVVPLDSQEKYTYACAGLVGAHHGWGLVVRVGGLLFLVAHVCFMLLLCVPAVGPFDVVIPQHLNRWHPEECVQPNIPRAGAVCNGRRHQEQAAANRARTPSCGASGRGQCTLCSCLLLLLSCGCNSRCKTNVDAVWGFMCIARGCMGVVVATWAR